LRHSCSWSAEFDLHGKRNTVAAASWWLEPR